MKRFIFSVISFSLLILVSCQREPLSGYTPIEFNVLQEDFTKAAAVTTPDIVSSGFYACATTGAAGSEVSSFANALFTVSGDKFVSNGVVWPGTDPGYHFYGSNVTMTHSANGPYVDATTATDIVCGVNASPVYKSTNGLTLKHIFGRIGPVVVSSDAGYVLSGASLYITPNTGGRYHLRAGDGQVDGTGWSNLTAGTPVNLCNADGGTKVNDLYIVPGSYELTATWTMSKSGGSHTFTDKVVEVEIPAGQYNTITLNFGDGGMVYSVVTQIGESVSWSGPLNDPEEIDWEVLLPQPAYLPGEFSVSSTKKVQFAKGNLQAVIGGGPSDTYNYSASEWKFAEKQYDIIGNAAGNTSLAAGTTVDLFGWVGASASYDSYGLCTNTSYNNAYYGTSASDAFKTDWGSIPGVVSSYGDGWFTLTSTQWNYLFTQRANASSLYGHCQISTANGTVTGMLILPDDWTKPSNCTVTPGTGAFDRVTYSATAASGASNAWVEMEAAGAVFLPAAGCRYGVGVYDVGSNGIYWSSSVYNENYAYGVYFDSGYLSPQTNNYRYLGFSVRLVKEVN